MLVPYSNEGKQQGARKSRNIGEPPFPFDLESCAGHFLSAAAANLTMAFPIRSEERQAKHRLLKNNVAAT
jgi:hypothetical protein